jgi:hypothetical protein
MMAWVEQTTMHTESSTSARVEYRPVVEAPETYRVGDDGSVWSRAGVGRYQTGAGQGPWRRLKPHPNTKSGHMTVFLGRGRMRYVHQLVLEAFVGPCPPGMQCRHLDNNPANNRLDNIVWGTPVENGGDRIEAGTTPRGEDHSRARLTEDDVRAVMAMRDAGMGIRWMARYFNVHEMTIQAIVYGRSWKHVTGL